MVHSPAQQRVAAVAFGAAVPGLLLAAILGVKQVQANQQPSDDDPLVQSTALPSPAVSLTPDSPYELPPVSSFRTDSASGYAEGSRDYRNKDLFTCAPKKPVAGRTAKPEPAASCQSRPKER